MIYVAFNMTIRDGECEYGTDYVASIDSNCLSPEKILETLQREVAMPELDINPDNKDEYEIYDDGKIEAHNGDYRFVWISKSFKLMPKEHFEIMKKYGICAFENLLPATEAFQFR